METAQSHDESHIKSLLSVTVNYHLHLMGCRCPVVTNSHIDTQSGGENVELSLGVGLVLCSSNQWLTLGQVTAQVHT